MTHAPNPTLRDRASFTLRMHLERIIMLNLAVLAATYLVNGLGLFTSFSGVFENLEDMFESSRYRSSSSFDFEAILAPLMSGLGTASILSLVSTVFGAILNTGYIYGLILLAQDTPVKGSVLICRWKHALGSIGLNLWIAVKTAFWALPGLGVILMSGAISSATTISIAAGYEKAYERRDYDYEPSEFGYGLAKFVAIVGLILIVALLIPATMRFAMGTYAFAEKPSMGVYDAVEYSKRMMYGRKWQLFCLTLPYILGMVGLVLAVALINWLLGLMEAGAVIAFLTPFMSIGVIVGFYYLGLLAQVATAHFYNEYKEKA